jgi:hypothetical protein
MSWQAYETMPIEEFGMAMLRGMGWSEGMGVGRNRKVAEAIEYLKRPERLGLGAQAVLEAGKSKKPRKMGKGTQVQVCVWLWWCPLFDWCVLWRGGILSEHLFLLIEVL